MTVNRHCYLIMAHNEFDLLKKMISYLDDEGNDIYLHIDKKVKRFDFEQFRAIPKYSKLHFVKRHNVHWGAYSHIETEMELFKTAYQGGYSRYHLISGVDLPLKTIDEIYRYSEERKNSQFINMVSKEFIEQYPRDERFKYYHFFEEIDVRRRGIGRIDKISLKLQEILGVDRWKNHFEYGFGSNWVSLTNEAVKFLIDHEKWIRKSFRFTHCCDELFVQTTLLKGDFQFENYKRTIIWSEDDSCKHPKTLGIEDFEALTEGEAFFARKVSSKDSKELIDAMYRFLDSKKKLNSRKR